MQPLQESLRELFARLAQHGRAQDRGDARATHAAARFVADQVERVVHVAAAPEGGPLLQAPPRPVGVAMARALFSAPHLSQTLSVYTTASDTEVFHPTPALGAALGLSLAELEELRDEVDQRVSQVLRQSRALHWLWHRAGNPRFAPDGLFQLLFPGVTHPRPHHFAYRGCRLYAVFPQDAPPPPEALYLRWLPDAERWTCIPDSHFAARYVDPAVVRALARAIGATDAEVTDLLDATVCAVPLHDEHRFVHHDRWRSEGWAALTGLASAPSTAWLTLPLAPEAIPPEGWIERADGGLRLVAPRRVLDRHAMSRVTAVTHGLQAELLARFLGGRDPDAEGQALLFDLDPYLQRVLQPLLDWTASPRTHAALAQRLQVEPAHVGAALGQVRRGWLAAARASWGGVPTAERPWTVQAVLAAHLAVTQASLHRAWRREADDRGAHHRVLLLFFAHYVARAGLGRLWRPVDGRVPPPEDVVGAWFWGTWLRVLDAQDA